ncbi:GNAT family N-acetyltransferase [Archangium violaceum]|uniref:GNAT family N-acetyltransferase n=1 Tax=Archangium violaceum TaxID=83451 RepID=UPI0036DDB4B2
MTLPAPTSRGYAGEVDLSRMQALVRDAWRQYGPRVECTVGDLDWRLYRRATVEPGANIRLWEAGETLVGFAWFLPNGDLDILVHPREHCASVAAEMVAWGEARLRASGDTEVHGRPLHVWALASNEPLSRALRVTGLHPTSACYLHLFRELDVPLDAPPLPRGFHVRAVAGPSEAAARAAVHRVAFGSERVSTEVYARLMHGARHYRPEFDVVAVAPRGEFAAMALGWLDPDNLVGELEPVGTAPAYRGLGLARAVSHEALRLLRVAGARSAVIYALPDNEASVTLYASLGFREFDRNVGFVRPPP